jgi:hypothetical protein
MFNKIFLDADKALAYFNESISLYGMMLFKEHGVFRHLSFTNPCQKMPTFELSNAMLILLAKHEEYVRNTKDGKGVHLCEEQFWSRFTSEIGCGNEPINLTVFRKLSDSKTDSFSGGWIPKLMEDVLA